MKDVLPGTYIGCQWTIAESPTKVVCPIDESSLGYVSFSNEQMVELAYTAAQEAKRNWSKLTLDRRVGYIKLVIKNLAKFAEDISQTMTKETGKPITESIAEVNEAIEFSNFLCEEAYRILISPQAITVPQNHPTKFNYLRYNPLGVVAVIKTWNFPVELPIWSIVTALLVGNTVIYKTSEKCILTSIKISDCFEKAKLPTGVFNLLSGGPSIAKELLEFQPNCVSFTGRSSTGSEISKTIAGTTTKLNLELGGKDAFVVLSDADIETAAKAATWGAFCNCGQVCTSTERIIVEQNVFDYFVERLIYYTEMLTIGDPRLKSTDLGPLISEDHRRSVNMEVKRAVSQGASILLGGSIPSHLKGGYYYSPTILAEVNTEMPIWKYETFGPVVSILMAESPEDAVKIANNCIYDLGASIWTRSLTNAFALSNQIDAGMIWINDVNVAFCSSPWGGRNKSGGTKELSNVAFCEYSSTTLVSIEHGGSTDRPWWFPYSKT